MPPREFRPPEVGPGQPVVFFKGSDLTYDGLDKHRRNDTTMRLRGTGTAPEGQYPKGQICDGTDAVAAELLEKGWVEQISPGEDPGRSVINSAQAVVRGDTLSHPHDAAVAERFQGAGSDPDEGQDPYAVVAEQDPDAEEAHVTPEAGSVDRLSEGYNEVAPAADTATVLGRTGSTSTTQVVGDSAPDGDYVGEAGQDAPVGQSSEAVGDGTSPVSASESSSDDPSGDASYSDQSKDDLQSQADARGLDVEGSGADGNVLKDDLVAALEADDATK